MNVAARTLAGEPDSVARARCWVADVLRIAGCENRLVEATVFVTSELVTNAVRHTASGYSEDGVVRVEVLISAHRVRVRVIDAGTEKSEPTVPRARPDPDNAEAARGLYLVDQWAERFGFYGDTRGRTVFADIASPSWPDDVGGARVPGVVKRVRGIARETAARLFLGVSGCSRHDVKGDSCARCPC